MIAGFGGALVSHAYVEELLAEADRGALVTFEKRIVRWWQQVGRSLGPASSARSVLDVAIIPLLELLGHDRPHVEPQSFGFSAEAPSSGCVLLALPWSTSTRSAWRHAIAFSAAASTPWAMVCNGHSLRIVDGTRAWTRAAIEFEFARLTTAPAGIAALRLMCNATAMSGRNPRSLRSHVVGSDAHASRVCRSLSDGVLAALPRLASALASSTSTRQKREMAFDQALTVVYRILFLLFAEARSLVPVWNEIYRDAYTIGALTDRADRDCAAGLWAALQAISRLAHAGCKAGELDVTAFNGRLFSPKHSPLVEQRRVPDAVIRDVLLSLATEPSRQGRRRISYHDLGVEQLGSVYERVLEYEPGTDAGISALAHTSTKRKETGSFYTPQSLTEFLVSRTLSPLTAGKSLEQILDLRVLDPAMGSGAFLVAACRYLAECCEQAMIADGRWPGPEGGERHRATLRRLVAERCLYGVDLNPTAVQLARLSLWLTTLAADRPLTFLDHHLATGNSLIGAWLSDLSRPPQASRPGKGSTTLPLFDDEIAGDVARQVLPARLRLALEPSDSLAAVKNKERSLAELSRADGVIARWTAGADAWCAAVLWPESPPSAGIVNEWVGAATGGATSLPAASLRASLERARSIAASHGALHWELAFPEVFFDAAGRPDPAAGFDAVIGNPPWDMMRADSGSAIERDGLRSTTRAALRFCRMSRAYRHQGSGHPNRYQLFLERALRLTKPGGRVGLLLPSGIATDHGSATLRRHLFDRTSIDTWLGFDNKHRIFPIHRSMRFVVLSTTNAGSTDTLTFQCGLTRPEALHRSDRGGEPLTVSRSRLERWSPEHLTIPEVTNATALGIMSAIAERVPPMADAMGWGARFGRELNATEDRPHFKRSTSRSEGQLAIIEGKQLSPYQVDVGRSQFGINRKDATPLLPEKPFDRARIAYRDVASATNKWTLIAAMLPAGTVSTHTVFCLKSALPERSQWCLLALLNSLIANYLVRMNVTTHVTASLMSRLPVPRPEDQSPEFKQLVKLSRRLAATGVTEESEAYAELNAIAARLYGVTADEYAHVLATFPLISSAQRDLCLATYVRATESRKHG